MAKTPIILIAFANNAERPLEQLSKEDEVIYEYLIPLMDKKEFVVHRESNATVVSVYKRLVKSKDRLVLFLYAGHANSEKLDFHDEDFQIAHLLTNQPNLKLVVLNGCATKGHVDQLLKCGIPAVIATSVKINDFSAYKFAKAFFYSLVNGLTLEKAFDYASYLLKGVGSSDMEMYRGGFNLNEFQEYFPWGLFYNNEAILRWKLTEAEAKRVVPHKLTYVPLIDVETEAIGRESDLEILVEILNSSEKAILIHGIAGIGKSTFARAYVKKYSDRYNHIAWIERVNDFSSAFVFNKDLQENLGLKFEENETESEVLRKTLLELRNLNGINLLVLDNSDREILDFAELLPCQPSWHVLITSQERFKGFKEFRLNELDHLAAKELFLTYYSGDADDSALKELFVYVGYHTLAIELMAKTLENSFGINTVRDLIHHLKNRQLNDEEIQRIVEVSHSKGETELYEHLAKTFDLINLSDDEIIVLKKFLFLPPIPIPFPDLAKVLRISKKETKAFTDTLIRLNKKGRVRLGLKENAFQINRMFREVLFYKLNPALGDALPIFKSVSGLLFKRPGKDNPTDKFKWIPYGEALLRQFEKDDHNSKNTLRNNLGLIYRATGNYERAVKLLEIALESDLRVVSKDDPNVAATRSNLALVYHDLGQYEKAVELLELALKTNIENFGKDHQTTALTQSNLALSYWRLGQIEKAGGLLESSLESNLNHYEKDHPMVALTQSNLAAVYRDGGRYEEAAELLELALSSDLTNLGNDHPNVARKQSILGLVYRDLKQIKKAGLLMLSALKSDRKNFGNYHPNIVNDLSNLAVLHLDVGMFEEGADYLEAALLSGVSLFGKNNPNIAIIQSNLGMAYFYLNRYEQAARLLELALELNLNNFGKDHHIVANTQSRLGLVYKTMGNYEKASELLQKAYVTLKARLGPDDPNTRSVKELLTNV